MAINVLIADQERIFADALATRLDDEDDIGVMGAVQLKAPSAWAVTGKHPQVMLLDGDLPGGAANRICEQLSGCESTRIIMLSLSSEPERIVKAFQAGAAAWVGKNESLEHLLQVIRGVARGESWLPPSQTAGVVQLLLHAGEQRRQNECLLGTLTRRERGEQTLILPALFAGVQEQLYDVGRFARRQPALTPGNTADDLQQIFQGFVLAYPGGCTDLKCLNDPFGPGGKAKHDYQGRFAAGEFLADAVRRVAGQIAVEQHDLGRLTGYRQRAWCFYLDGAHYSYVIFVVEPGG